MSSGEIDVIKDYALPLPMTIITEILGVPARDHHKFHKWSKAVVSLTSPKATLRVIPSVWMFIRYLRQFFKMRRRSPRDDLATALIQAEEATARRLSPNLTGYFSRSGGVSLVCNVFLNRSKQRQRSSTVRLWPLIRADRLALPDCVPVWGEESDRRGESPLNQNREQRAKNLLGLARMQ